MRRAKVVFRLALTLFLIAVSFAVQAPVASAAPGDCIGTVFRDHNANGVYDLRADGTTVSDAGDPITDEPGEAGITVTAYDDTGAVVGTATTAVDGTFDLSTSVAAGTPIRIEFTWPGMDWLFSGPNGPDNMSSVQFAAAGACDLTFGVMNPGDYCQSDVFLSTSCYDLGTSVGSTSPALAAARYDWGATEGPFPDGSGIAHTHVDPAGDPAPPVKLAENQEIGTTWGQAWNSSTENLLLGAYMKASVDFGPGGPGAIYSVPTDPATGAATGAPVVFADLAALGYDVCDDPHGADLGDPVPALYDPAIAAVGKCAIGDMDISWDNSILYVMNLTSREIVQLDATSGADLGSWTFPLDQDTLPSGAGFCADPAVDIRPFALEEHDGKVYAGAVCSGESTGVAADTWAYVYEIDPATGAFTLAFQYSIDAEQDMNQPYYEPNAWVNDIATIEANGFTGGSLTDSFARYSQPMLTDIEFFNNDLVLGYRDRFGDQGGVKVPHDWPAVGSLLSFVGTGSDITCAASDGAGGFILEANDECGDRVSVDPNANEATEFYPDGGSVGHGEVSLGGLELIPGRYLAFTITNPSEYLESPRVDGVSERVLNSAGFAYADNFDGDAERGYIFYARSASDDPAASSRNALGKGNGLGDVEALCLAAPVEIGNYVWFDADGDGVQDPSEVPVVGATVNLYAADGVTLVATAVTGPNGEYYFDVDPDTDYVIKMDNAADYGAGGPLDGWALTQDSGDGDDDADSDGVDMDGFPAIMYTTGGPGQNDHTLDFGFTQEYDLALKKQLADGTNVGEVAPGDAVTFTLTVYNQASTDAANIEVVDYIPAGLTLADAAWTDNSDGTASLTTPIATLSGNSNTTVDITFIVDADATGRLDNIAEISAFTDLDGNEVDDVDSMPDATNDDVGPTTGGAADDDNVDGDSKAGEDEDDHDVASLTVAGTVDPDAPIFDLALRKQLSDGTNLGTFAVGDDVTFVLTVFNQGEVAAQDIEIVDYLPAGLTLNDADWTENSDGTASIVYTGLLAPGENISVEITFTIGADATGVIDNFAEIAAAYTEDGVLGIDIDSIADAVGGDTLSDDAIDANGLGGEDEDDHDIASIQIGSTLAKTGTSLTTVLLLVGFAALLIAGLIFGVKAMQKEQLAD